MAVDRRLDETHAQQTVRYGRHEPGKSGFRCLPAPPGRNQGDCIAIEVAETLDVTLRMLGRHTRHARRLAAHFRAAAGQNYVRFAEFAEAQVFGLVAVPFEAGLVAVDLDRK